jgi:rfaE bifunctional protein nucleotidyltransferase chain/domain
MSLKKFYRSEQLLKILQQDREKGLCISLANGCFSLIHIGHIRFLKGAAAGADKLVVAINSDRSIRNIKGGNRQILDEKARITILSSFQFVDYVTIFNEETVDELLFKLKPDFHCKGGDYNSPEEVPEFKTVKSYGGVTRIVGGEKIRSTSEITKAVCK